MRSKFLRVILSLSFTTALAVGPGSAWAACVGGAENGSQEGSEACDDGPNPCCNSDCTVNAAAAGQACDDFNDCTKAGKSTCDNNGDCGGGMGQTGLTCWVKNGMGNFVDCIQRTCQGKVCKNTPTNICEDGNLCTGDLCACTAATPCASQPTTANCTTHPNVPSGGACDLDGTRCTLDTCDGAGNCTYSGTTITCPPNSNVCKINQCNPTTGGCQAENLDQGTPCTSDGNQCTDDECGRTGNCKHFPMTGESCNDGNECTSGETCNNNNQCTNGFPQGGLPCNDNNICTSSSACDNTGACIGTACGAGNCPTVCGNPACTSTLTTCGCTNNSGG